MIDISIVIPVLNEEENIKKLLPYLREKSSKKNRIEIIVVDGGSDDNTTQVASSFKDIVVLNSKKGRALQMNHGAAHAKGVVLYFLHADSFPPKNYDRLIMEKIGSDYKAGCFRMQFEHKHWLLRFSGWLTRFPWKACRGGDQSLFITKNFFEELNGFDGNYIVYEDNDLINRIYKNHRFAVIQERLKTSARLYEKNGVCRLQYYFFMIHMKGRLGAKPESLHAYYRKHVRKYS